MTEPGLIHTTGEKERSPSLWGWHTFLSTGVTILLFVILGSYVDYKRLGQEINQCDKWLLLLAGLSHYATYPVRGIRWRYSLRHLPVQCGNARFGLLVFFYSFVDNLVPAKLGEFYAGHLSRINCGVRRSATLGSILFLRTLDAWIVFGLAALASWSLFQQAMPESVTWVLILGCLFAVVATGVMLLFVLMKRRIPTWFPEILRSAIEAFRSGMWPHPKELPPIVMLTMVIWMLETLWIFLLMRAFHLHYTGMESIFLTMIPLIASAFPVTPSGAGVVDLTMFTCLRVLGSSSPLAASVTVINRLIDYWLHIFLGVLIWIFRRPIGLRTWRDVPQKIRNNEGQ